MSGIDKASKGKSHKRVLGFESSASANQSKHKNKTEQQLLRHKLDDLEHQRQRSMRAIDEEERSLLRELEAQRLNSHTTTNKRMSTGGPDLNTDDVIELGAPRHGGHRFSLHSPIESPEAFRRRPSGVGFQANDHPERQWMRRQKLALERMSKEVTSQPQMEDPPLARVGANYSPPTASNTTNSLLEPPLLNRRRNSSTQNADACGEISNKKWNGVQRKLLRHDNNDDPSQTLNLDNDEATPRTPHTASSKRNSDSTLNFQGRKSSLGGGNLKHSVTSMRRSSNRNQPHDLHCESMVDFSDIHDDDGNKARSRGLAIDKDGEDLPVWAESGLKRQRGRIKSMSRSVNDIVSLSKIIDSFKDYRSFNETSSDSDAMKVKPIKKRMSHSQSTPGQLPQTVMADEEGGNDAGQLNLLRKPRLSKELSHFNKRLTDVDICNGAGTSNRIQLAPLSVKPSPAGGGDSKGNFSKTLLSPVSPASKRSDENRAAADTADATSLSKPKLEPIKNRSWKRNPEASKTFDAISSDSDNAAPDSRGRLTSRLGAGNGSGGRDDGGQAATDSSSADMRSRRRRRSHAHAASDSVNGVKEFLHGTQAQWEELGQFLGEIRRQHDLQQAQVSHRNNSEDETFTVGPTGETSKCPLPRRHSEGNVLLLARAIRGGDCRNHGPSSNSNNSSSSSNNNNNKHNSNADGSNVNATTTTSSITTSNSNSTRRNSSKTVRHGDSPSGHQSIKGSAQRRKNSTIKKLASFHTLLQSSALSMADIESETF